MKRETVGLQCRVAEEFSLVVWASLAKHLTQDKHLGDSSGSHHRPRSFNKAPRKRTKPPGLASLFWAVSYTGKGSFCLYLGVPTCRALLAGTDRAGRAWGPPSLPGQVIRDRGAEADGIGPGPGYGEPSTRQGRWVAGLSASLLGNQEAGGVCPPGRKEAAACHAQGDDIFLQPLPSPNSFLPALEEPSPRGFSHHQVQTLAQLMCSSCCSQSAPWPVS